MNRMKGKMRHMLIALAVSAFCIGAAALADCWLMSSVVCSQSEYFTVPTQNCGIRHILVDQGYAVTCTGGHKDGWEGGTQDYDTTCDALITALDDCPPYVHTATRSFPWVGQSCTNVTLCIKPGV
jgi:hypothetical protein